MTTTLDPSFLRAIVLMSGFRGKPMQSAQAALLLIGLHKETFLASDLPGEVTNGSKHLAGAATGALIAQELLEVVGRVRSPRPEAKGRKLDVLRIPSNKLTTAKTWLRNNGYADAMSAEPQLEMSLSA